MDFLPRVQAVGFELLKLSVRVQVQSTGQLPEVVPGVVISQVKPWLHHPASAEWQGLGVCRAGWPDFLYGSVFSRINEKRRVLEWIIQSDVRDRSSEGI